MHILSVSNFNLLWVGIGVGISLIYRQILGPLVLGLASNHFLLGAQLAPGEKKVSLYPCLLIPQSVIFHPLDFWVHGSE